MERRDSLEQPGDGLHFTSPAMFISIIRCVIEPNGDFSGDGVRGDVLGVLVGGGRVSAPKTVEETGCHATAVEPRRSRDNTIHKP
jgi:hypothetical protein